MKSWRKKLRLRTVEATFCLKMALSLILIDGDASASALNDEILSNWSTDGVSYFLEKTPTDLPIFAYLKLDSSDLMVVGRNKGIWVKSLKTPSEQDYNSVLSMPYRPNYSPAHCGKIGVDNFGNAANESIFSKVIIKRDDSYKIERVFSVFQDMKDPETRKGVITEEHYSPLNGDLIVRVKSANLIYVFSDCSIAVIVHGGVILFDGEGRALFPVMPGIRVVYDEELASLECEFALFYTSVKSIGRESLLQKKVNFYRSKLFGSQ